MLNTVRTPEKMLHISYDNSKKKGTAIDILLRCVLVVIPRMHDLRSEQQLNMPPVHQLVRMQRMQPKIPTASDANDGKEEEEEERDEK